MAEPTNTELAKRVDEIVLNMPLDLPSSPNAWVMWIEDLRLAASRLREADGALPCEEIAEMTTPRNITRLPTKYGQGHADAIGFFQDELLPLLIENRIACLALRGFTDDGTELQFTMTDTSGERKHNLRMLGMVAELQVDLANDIRSPDAP